MTHVFKGRWITTAEFAALQPRNVFSRQLDRVKLPCDEHRDRHVLFRKHFTCDTVGESAQLYVTADDYYKLYVNGQFVAQGPTPSYHFRHNYNVLDVRPFLRPGANVIAVHTLYQGLINRVWQSGDNRHGLLLDLVVDGKTVVASDATFKTRLHSGYTETGTCGYDTQFLERYDSTAPEVGFMRPDYDDGHWEQAVVNPGDDHKTVFQTSHMLTYEWISPVTQKVAADGVVVDFGANYVGYLCVSATGRQGDVVTVRCAQELNGDGTLRYDLRANCLYEETWVLAEGESTLDWFDYKSFRYVQLLLPQGVEIKAISLLARHYPFALQTCLKPTYAADAAMRRIWELCVHTQRYGVQEVIQDCMEREKGFYLGDGCYTALTNMLLTGDDSMVRRLIDDAFSTSCISDTLMTCMNCSFMQEIAEYPLILVLLVLWHYRYTGDGGYLSSNYPKVVALLEAYRRHYEKDGLLRDLDKWCVVEWPQNFRHGYDVDLTQGQICREAHVAVNAYYIAAVRAANAIAAALGHSPYREETPLLTAFHQAFYDEDRHLFCDGESTRHVSLVGNSFVYGFSLCADGLFQRQFLSMLREHTLASLSLFCTFPVLMGLTVHGEEALLEACLMDEGAWRRTLREGGTATFEGWGKDTKWNTSLFHLTMSYAAVFMADVDLKKLFLP